MQLRRLKRDHVVPSRCFCGQITGVYTVRCGRLLWQCDACAVTHEAHQQRRPVWRSHGAERRFFEPGEPLGVPCSATTKIYRLALHDTMDPFFRRGRVSKDVVYETLADALNLPGDKAHVACLDMAQCAQALAYFKSLQ